MANFRHIGHIIACAHDAGRRVASFIQLVFPCMHCAQFRWSPAAELKRVHWFLFQKRSSHQLQVGKLGLLLGFNSPRGNATRSREEARRQRSLPRTAPASWRCSDLRFPRVSRSLRLHVATSLRSFLTAELLVKMGGDVSFSAYEEEIRQLRYGSSLAQLIASFASFCSISYTGQG